MGKNITAMSEREPNREPITPKFRLTFESGLELKCNKNNTWGFTHENEPDGDHLYVFKRGEDGTIKDGDYVFREQIPNFAEILDYMKRTGFKIYESEDGNLDDKDRDAYNEYLNLSNKNKPVTEPQNSPQPTIPELDWISPRQERLISNAVGFLIYLAENEKL